MAVDWQGFRNAAVKKYPQYAKQIDDYISKKQTVDAVQSGKITIDQLPTDMRAPVAAQLPADFEIQSKKQKESQEVKSEVKNKADALISVLQAGKSGKLSGDNYKTALNAAASSLAAAQGFGQGGKNLTGSELSILAGQMPRIEQSRQRIWDTIRGVQTPQTGNVVDSDEELMRKATILSKGLGQNGANIGDILASAPSAEKGALDASGLLNNVWNGNTTPESKFSLAGLLNNVVANIKRTGEGAGKLALDVGKASYENPAISNIPLVGPLVGGLTSQGPAGQQLRQDAAAIPGGLLEYAKSAIDDPAKFVYQNPVDVATTAIGGLSKSSIRPKVGNLPEDIKGRVATSLATPDPANVTASENAMKNVLQMTKSNTVRGMARELETFNTKANKYIDQAIKPISEKVGSMGRDEIVDQVIRGISESEVAKTNPELLNKIQMELQSKLNTGAIQNPSGNGELFSTTLEKINEARKQLNKQTSNWHNSGRQLTTDANQYSALRYEASKVLRDILTGTSGLEDLNDAIKLQHSAIEASPAIATEALKGTRVQNSIVPNIIQAAKTATVPARVAVSRLFQGPGSDVIQKILGQ